VARLSRDSLEFERRGRVVGEDDYRATIRARARELLSVGGGSFRNGRGGSAAIQPSALKAVAGLKAGGPSNQSILKVVNWTKERRAAMAQAKYAARTRDEDPPEKAVPMLNEAGRELNGVEIEAEVKSWNLKRDSENLSTAAKAATAAERAAMPAKERLHRRQAAHLIFSVPSHAPVDAQRLQQAVSLALRDTVGEGGFRYVSTIHTDHSSRPHAHIIIKATSEPMMIDGREKTTQLRLGPRDLETMRHVFTRHAQEQGINVVATRREDREHLRAEILAGRAPLRENDRSSVTRKTRQSRAFERRAPQWYAEYGAAYERRRLAAASEEPSTPPAPDAIAVPQERPGLLGRFAASFGRRRREAGPASSGSESAIVAPSQGYFGNSMKRRTPAAPEIPVKDRENPAGAALKSGGYFENFENYRKGARRTKAPGVSAATPEAKIAAHFAITHRDSEHAAASFRAMLRESPKMALWAAHKHPIAFGEPSGAVAPGLRWKDVHELLPHGASNEPSAAPSLGLDPVLAGQRQRIREQIQRTRADQAGKRAPAAIGRSLARLARWMERETATDPDAAGRAAHIRAVARGLAARDIPAPDQAHDQGRRIEAGKKDPAMLYKELEEQLWRRDQMRGKQKSRDRADDGRDR
jgi:hypothetical protein